MGVGKRCGEHGGSQGESGRRYWGLPQGHFNRHKPATMTPPDKARKPAKSEHVFHDKPPPKTNLPLTNLAAYFPQDLHAT